MAYFFRKLTGKFERDKKAVLGVLQDSAEPLLADEITEALSKRGYAPVDGGYLRAILGDFPVNAVVEIMNWTSGRRTTRYYAKGSPAEPVPASRRPSTR